MDLKVSPVQGVSLTTRPLNTRIKNSKEETKKVSSFYRRYYDYDSEGHPTLQGVPQRKLDMEV